MEFIVGRNALALVDDEKVLYCCLTTGRLTTRTTSCLVELEDPQCLGIIHGFIGKLPSFSSVENATLLVVTQKTSIAKHPLTQNEIFKIDRIAAIPLCDQRSSFQDLVLDVCPKHIETNDSMSADNLGLGILHKGQKKILKTTRDSFQFVKNQVGRDKKNKSQNTAVIDEKQNKRLLDEVVRLFNEGRFYMCSNGADLTNTCQRLVETTECNYDDRFFWNKYLLSELYENSSPDAGHWICPIIQGFVGQVSIDLSQVDSKTQCQLMLTLISRRSIYRAGTRYIKRGIDEYGHCANYVETEQIVTVFGHNLSFVQIRGSVPLFWSQRGYKYRPPPHLDCSKSEAMPAFKLHIEEQLSIYDSPLAMVNLIDQTGREKPLGDGFLDQVLEQDNENIVFIAFDFHDYCRGLNMDNIAILMDASSDVIRSIRFAWIDSGHTLICKQNGVFRVNCVDCLDRTNVVQSSLAQLMLEYQLVKLGVLQPLNDRDSLGQFNGLPDIIIKPMQLLWSDNGDSISLQYAGTAALKGDITRSGQRNLAGLMRDGYNSASRYYLCHMRDARRQVGIDALLGRHIDATSLSDEVENEVPQHNEVHEELRMLVQECQRYFVLESENLVGGWALVDTDPGLGKSDNDYEMDRIILLSRTAYYVVIYDEVTDKFTDCRRVPLESIEKMDVGPMSPSRMNNLLSRRKKGHTCLRIHNKNRIENEYAKFYVWRAAGTRLFNNMAIPLKTEEEADEYVRAIGEQFQVALEIGGFNIGLEECTKMERVSAQISKPSFTPSNVWLLRPNFRVDLAGIGSKVSSPIRRVFRGRAKGVKAEDDSFVSEIENATANIPKYQSVIVSSSAGILYVYDGRKEKELKALENTDEFEFASMTSKKYAYDDTALLSKTLTPMSTPIQSRQVHPPLFFVEQASDNISAINSPCELDTKFIETNINLVPSTSVTSLRSAEDSSNVEMDIIDLANKEFSMKTSKSEGTLQDINQTNNSDKKSGRNRFMGKLATGSGKLLDFTVSSLAKVSSQVQMLGSGAARKVSTGNEKGRQSPMELFDQFQERISKSRSRIIIL